jgi:glycosyltransferase involved in cell wall biosynthesis
VIIPTWNRRALVREAIESFRAQTLAPELFEVIVVDNCSTDGTAELVAELAREVRFALRYHRMPENRGPVRSRNTGAALAEAPLLAFTDSDCIASPQWLAAAVRVMREDDSAAFATGPILDKPGQRSRFFTVGSALPGENPTYPTANVVYRRAIFEAAGGFDEEVFRGNVGGAPVECADADLAWRVKEAGHHNAFSEELVVYHEVMRVTPWQWIMWCRRVGLVPELIRRHPGLRTKLAWWGPFALLDNFLFYLALAGVAAAAAVATLASPAISLPLLALALPHLARTAFVRGERLTLRRLALMPARVALLTVRQAAICGFLVYGSIRARTLVL